MNSVELSLSEFVQKSGHGYLGLIVTTYGKAGSVSANICCNLEWENAYLNIGWHPRTLDLIITQMMNWGTMVMETVPHVRKHSRSFPSPPLGYLSLA